MSVEVLGGSAGSALLLDRCPNCCGPESVSPGRLRLTDDGSEIRCAYYCRSCGHVWAVGHRAEAYTPAELAAVVAHGAALAGAR